MIRPATKHALEFLGGAVGVCALGAGILAFKLASGPVSLKFMAPTFAAVLREELGGDFRFDLADADLRWSRQSHALAVELKGINLYDRSGVHVAGIPALEVGVSLDGLQHGLIAPTRINLEKASILVERAPSGTFSIGAPPVQPAASSKPAPSVLPLILDKLFSAKGPRNAASYLTEVVVEDADITLIDRRTGVTVHAPDARLNVQRTEHGFKGELEATAQVGDEHTHMTLAGAYDLNAKAGTLDLGFSPFRLSHLAPLSKFYADFAPLDMPVGGQARLELGKSALITRADLALRAQGGRLAPGAPDNAVEVQSAAFKGTYWPQTGEIAIDSLKVDAGKDRGDFHGHVRLRTAEGTPLRVLGASFAGSGKNVGFVWPGLFGEPVAFDQIEADADVTFGASWSAIIKSAKVAFGPARIEVAGDVSAGAGSPAVHINGEVTDFPAADVDRYWPQTVAVHARNWVMKHILGGRITKGLLHIDAPGGAFAAAAIDEKILKFDFRAENVESTYAGDLPPITGASADMTLTPTTFTAKIDKAKILGADISAGRVFIPQLGVKGSPIEIVADASGRIEEFLDILDHQPLAIPTKYGLKPKDISGDATLHASLTVPQQSDDPGDKITYAVAAKAEHVTLPKIGQHIVIDSGTFELNVDTNGLKGSGRVAVNGAPTDIVWHERFHDKSATPSEFIVHASLDEEARASLGVDTGTSLTGPVVIDVSARGKGPAIRALTAKLDFTRAAVDFADMGWRKSAGAPAKANLEVAIAPDGTIRAQEVRARGQGIEISGSAALGPDGRLLQANFPRLRLDGLVDLAVSTERSKSDGFVVKLSGRYLKLGPIFKNAMSKGDHKLNMPWRVEASIDRASLRNDVEASDLRATLASSGTQLTTLNARGKFAGDTEFTALLSETADATRRITIDSSDAGRLVEGVTGIKSILGGRLSLVARLSDSELPQIDGAAAPSATAIPVAVTNKPKGGIDGTLRIDTFKVVDAPLLARLLTVGSLQGLGDLLKGEGIQFARLQVPFWAENGSIGIEDARASGPAIGITLQGVINRKKETTELNGTIVPAFTLNSALGQVPVLGPLLISRKGEGLIGFTYNIAGSMDDPRLMVNPLSALAPGFLRRLFELGDAQAGAARPSGRDVTQ